MKKTEFLYFFIVVFSLVLFCSCSNDMTKIINLADDKHPVCQIEYADFMEMCQPYCEAVRAYFEIGEDFEDFHLALDGSKKFFYSQSANKLYIAVLDKDFVLIREFFIEANADMLFYDFAENESGKTVGLACDSNGITSFCELDGNAIRSIQTLDSETDFKFVVSDGNDFILSGDNVIRILDENLFEKGFYNAEHISGLTFSSDNLFVLTETVDSLELVTLNKTNSKVICEYKLNLKNNEQYWGVNGASMLSVGESALLLSLDNAVYYLDLVNKSSEVMLNNLDMGYEFLYLTGFDDGSVKAVTVCQDIYEDEYKYFLTDIEVSNNTDKTPINIALLCSSDLERYFQHINRTSKDFYINIIDFTDDDFTGVDYAELITDSDIDMMVFDDFFCDSLINNNYLINLNDYGMSFDSEYFVYPSYCLNLYFYNPVFYNGDADINQVLTSGSFVELFANQNFDMLAEEYFGIIFQEYMATGEVSIATINNYLSLCSLYDNYYFEEDTMVNEIRNGSFMFLNTEISNIESLYSVYCYYNGVIDFCAPFGYCNPVAVPEVCLGITSTSNNVEMCKEIISFLMSENVQMTFDLPYNENIMNEKIDSFVNLLDEEKALSIINENLILSDADAAVYDGELTQIVDSITNGTHSAEDDEHFSTNTLPHGVNVFLETDELISFSNFAKDVFANYETITHRPDELVSILIEEACAYISNGVDIDYSTEILYGRVQIYISENW